MVLHLASKWSALKDRVQRSSNVLKFSEPTVFRVEPNSYHRVGDSMKALGASLSAGFGMLAEMCTEHRRKLPASVTAETRPTTRVSP
jgi:hypothetical protein